MQDVVRFTTTYSQGLFHGRKSDINTSDVRDVDYENEDKRFNSLDEEIKMEIIPRSAER